MLLLQASWNALQLFLKGGPFISRASLVYLWRLGVLGLCVPISEMESKFAWTRVNLQPQVLLCYKH